MEKTSNVTDLARYRFTKPITVLVAWPSGKGHDVSFLYDIYHIDPDILVCIGLDPFLDEEIGSLEALYNNSHIVDVTGNSFTAVYSYFDLHPKAIVHPFRDVRVPAYNIVVGPCEGGLNLMFACGKVLDSLDSVEGLWVSEPASDGLLMLDHSYMIARNLEVIDSNTPTDIISKGMKFVFYNFLIKEVHNG